MRVQPYHTIALAGTQRNIDAAGQPRRRIIQYRYLHILLLRRELLHDGACSIRGSAVHQNRLNAFVRIILSRQIRQQLWQHLLCVIRDNDKTHPRILHLHTVHSL